MARLQALADGAPTDERIARDAAIVYRALSGSLGDSASHSDLSKRDLRKAFDEGDGLIATRLGWRTPNKVLAGPAVFGEYMPFAPQVPGTDELWDVLRLPKPSMANCIAVLRRMARGGRLLSGDDEVVQLETLRLLADRYRESARSEDRRKLGKLPLWTTLGWKKDGPVFATDDEALADALGTSLPLWKPGGELEQFQALLGPLRVEVIASADAEVVETGDCVEDPEATRVFRVAVGHLQEDLLRNEPAAAHGLRARWEEVREFTVWAHPTLMLAVRLPESAGGGTRRCGVHVHVDADGRKVFVRDVERDLPRADRGGRALAALFEGERRHVAQAWRTAWDRAEDGVEASRLELAEQRAERQKEETRAEIERELAALRTRTGRSHKLPAGGRGGLSRAADERARVDGGGQGQEAGDGGKLRVLVDPELLTVVDPTGRVAGDSSRITGVPPHRKDKLVEPDGTRSLVPRSRTRLRGYTDLERETVGFELARKVLSSDQAEIIDLRAQRGVGADAMDELARFYELKVSAGGEPNDVSLTNAEWQRAQISQDFFLVVVSGVEAEQSRPSVRIIARPLDQLEQRVSGTVILSGVRDAKSVIYEFAPVTTVSASEELDPRAKA